MFSICCGIRSLLLFALLHGLFSHIVYLMPEMCALLPPKVVNWLCFRFILLLKKAFCSFLRHNGSKELTLFHEMNLLWWVWKMVLSTNLLWSSYLVNLCLINDWTYFFCWIQRKYRILKTFILCSMIILMWLFIHFVRLLSLQAVVQLRSTIEKFIFTTRLGKMITKSFWLLLNHVF